MNDINDVIAKLRKLNLEQQEQVAHLINDISESNHKKNQSATRKANSHERTTRDANPHFISSNGIALARGDKVRVLSNRKTGKYGDIATVLRFNKTYVAIQLERNRSNTQRAPKYLEYIPSTSGQNE